VQVLSRILLAFENDQLSHYYESMTQSLGDFEYVIKKNVEDATATFLAEKFDLVFTSLEMPGASQLMDTIIKADKAVPCVLTCFQKNLAAAKKHYKSQTLLFYFAHGGPSRVLFDRIEKMLKVGARNNAERKFCRVNLSFFYSTKEVFCDVYLKVGPQKFVKVFNRYEKVDSGQLKKYEARNIHHLFVRDRDFELITRKLIQQIRPMFEAPEDSPQAGALQVVNNDRLAVVFPMQLQETVTETINQIGLTEEAVELTNYAINTTLALVEKQPEIYKLLETSLKGQNYVSEHSFLLSYLTCAVLKETELYSEENSLSLTVAAFFHDTALENPELAKVQELNSGEYNNLGICEQEEVRKHVEKAVELVLSIEGLPGDVMTIISQHHELYEGGGFPKGIDYRRIHPLSAVFNVCHELCLYIYESGMDHQNVRQLLREFKAHYTKGNFAVAVAALERVFQVTSPLVGDNNQTKSIA
jgi:HD-GYP domain-containing protein (c-di-GMP phosphodiesterase class II)